MPVLDACEARIVDDVRVEHARSAMPPGATVERVADVFGLLADRGRIRLLIALREGDELCVCDLAATAGMSESATSHALRLLRASGVVKVRRAGRMAFYSLHDAHVRVLLDVTLEHLAHEIHRG